MKAIIENLKKKRDENFAKIGQCLLQKKYYEERIEYLLNEQKSICSKIFTETKIDKEYRDEE